MLNQWLAVLLQASAGPLLGFAMDSMQTVRENAPPKWVRVGTWCGLFLLSAVYQIFGRKYEYAGANYLNWFLFIVVMLASMRFFYAGRLLHKIAVNLILILSFISAELVTGFMLWILQIPSLSFDYTKIDMTMISFTGAIGSNTAIFLTTVLWKKFKMQKPTPRGSWIFIVMSLCLLAPTEIFCEKVIGIGGTVPLLHVLAMAGALLLNFVLICVQFNQAEKDEAEKELAALKRQAELERQRYESLEARQEEMAKIRHDYNNHLSSVLGLMHMGKPDEAEKVLESLLAKVEQTEDCQEKRSFSMEEDEC